MKTSDEIDVLECRVRGLENELRKTRVQLIDTYYPAILNGLIAKGWSPDSMVVEHAHALAVAAIEQRNKSS